MKFTFTDKDISRAPASYVRVRITEKETRRFVIEGGVETLEIGVGKWGKINRRKFITLCRSVVSAASQNKCRRIAVQLNTSPFPQMKSAPLPELASLIAHSFEMANFEFTKYKTPPKDGFNTVEEVLICGDTPKNMKEGFAKGQTVGKEVNACRFLANTPGGDMTPHLLALAARKAVKGLSVKVTVLGPQQMKKLGMGAILGVAKGSKEEPRFIIMEYKGDPSPKMKAGGKEGRRKPLVFVGKGVTFDSGGLNVKPGDSMLEMHMDMSGGAAVIHALALAARLKVKRDIIGLVPAVENMPSGSSYRPGDVLKSLSGKTIEILNTDAEGRVILADALTYAKRYDPLLVVEASTLTGAVLTALGQYASAMLTRDEKIGEKIRELGEQSGDYVWPMPLWEEYEDMVKGNFGDVSNIPASGNTRYGGVIGGGMFLQKFAEGHPFVHLDIASRMVAAPGEHLSKGAAGTPVRLFLAIAENL